MISIVTFTAHFFCQRTFAQTKNRRAGLIGLLTILLMLVCQIGFGAEKKWVKLTDCRYMEQTYNDGDSFRVKSGTNEFNLRLYYVDSPETNMRYPERTREQSEHFGITLDETLKAGRKARDFVRETLNAPFVIWTRWATAGGQSKEPRYYCLVEVGGKGLAEILVSKGLARTKGVVALLPTGEKSRAYQAKLQALETEAKQKKVGAWETTKSEKSDKVEK
jgi:endonuclease YncB( thermonuclease family)